MSIGPIGRGFISDNLENIPILKHVDLFFTQSATFAIIAHTCDIVITSFQPLLVLQCMYSGSHKIEYQYIFIILNVMLLLYNIYASLGRQLFDFIFNPFRPRCIQMEYPLLAEYDFRNDTHNPDIK